MNITLIKINQTENSTASSLYVEDKFVCFIIEDGEHDSKIHGATRVDPGTYKMIRNYKTKFKYGQFQYCWHIIGFQRHDLIMIHPGNTIADTEGCLLPNAYLGFDGKNYFGVSSKAVYLKLMDMLAKQDEHTISIFR